MVDVRQNGPRSSPPQAREATSPCTAPEAVSVLMLCGVGCGNVGNDASFEVARQLLTDELGPSHVSLATPFVDGARELDLGEVHVLRARQDYRAASQGSCVGTVLALALGEGRRLREAVRVLRSVDLVLVPGTGIFDDFGERPWRMPYALLSWVALARVTRRPFALVAVGAGPIVSRLNRWQFRQAVRMSTTVSYRDQGSKEYMEGVGAGRPDAVVCPDLVFAHTVPAVPTSTVTTGRLTVGVGVMWYGGWSGRGEGEIYDAYVAKMVNLVRRLVAAGHQVHLLVGQPCDHEVAARIMQECVDLPSGPTVPPIHDFASLVAAVGRTDVVIATRYHTLVAALMMRRPVISMGYAPKNADLLSSLGIDGFDRPVEEAEPSWVMERLSQIQSGGVTLPAAAERLLDSWADETRAEVGRVLSAIIPSGRTRSRSRTPR